MATEAKTRRVFRVFWAWNDDREEAWLREMARQGWHLRQAALVLFTFERGEAADVVYKLDYRRVAGEERGEYLGLFRAAGWEHVGEVANWHYFRTQAEVGSSPDIFSDTESRAAKYRRILGLLIIVMVLLNVGLGNLLRRNGRGPDWAEGVYLVGTAGYVLLILFFAYAIVRLVIRIRQLGRDRSV